VARASKKHLDDDFSLPEAVAGTYIYYAKIRNKQTVVTTINFP
jgi:hypothetical protein